MNALNILTPAVRDDLVVESYRRCREQYLESSRLTAMFLADEIAACVGTLAEICGLDLIGIPFHRTERGNIVGARTTFQPVMLTWILEDLQELDNPRTQPTLGYLLKRIIAGNRECRSIIAVEVENAQKAIAAQQLAQFKGGPFAAQTG